MIRASKDIEILNSREIEQYMPNYRVPTECQLASSSEQCTIDAVDGQTTHMCLSNVSDKRSETGGLHSVLKLAIGARVMLTANVDGLVNGARGEVVHIVTNTDHAVTRILV